MVLNWVYIYLGRYNRKIDTLHGMYKVLKVKCFSLELFSFSLLNWRGLWWNFIRGFIFIYDLHFKIQFSQQENIIFK